MNGLCEEIGIDFDCIVYHYWLLCSDNKNELHFDTILIKKVFDCAPDPNQSHFTSYQHKNVTFYMLLVDRVLLNKKITFTCDRKIQLYYNKSFQHEITQL